MPRAMAWRAGQGRDLGAASGGPERSRDRPAARPPTGDGERPPHESVLDTIQGTNPPDQIRCGPGNDLVIANRGQPAPRDCERFRFP
jgi:hypothetical protein